MLVLCSDWSHPNSTLHGRDGVLEAVRLSCPESPWDSQLCAEESLWSPLRLTNAMAQASLALQP